MKLDFTGKNVLVIGGTGGLGSVISEAFRDLGATVCATGHQSLSIRTTPSVDGVSIGQAETDRKISMDITDIASVRNSVNLLTEYFKGRLDILVNCAGVNVREPIEQLDYSTFDSIQKVNTYGAVFVTKEFLPLLKKSTAGRIIHITSIFSKLVYQNRCSYSISKAGLLQLVRTAALEFSKFGITVNSISPGPMLTEINKKVIKDKSSYEEFIRHIPLGRFGDPSEIIMPILMLASVGGGYITGTDILVDGGWSLL